MDIPELKSMVDIVNVVEQFTSLIGNGDRLRAAKGENPIRSDGSGDFDVWHSSQKYWDHGLQEGGDVIDFLEKVNNSDTKHACNYLKNYLGIDDRSTPMPKPIKRKPQPKPELTKERHSEIMADLRRFDQSLQSFKNLDYAKEVLAIVPTWVWKHAGKTKINLFRELTTFDQDNKTLVLKIHDYSGKIISYKRRRFKDRKWDTAYRTHPNSQCIVSIVDDREPVYILEGHHDLLTAILLGINVLMVPTVGYKVFNAHELSVLSGKDVVFLPDMAINNTQSADAMEELYDQAESIAKSVNMISVAKILDHANIPFDSDKADLSEIVEHWDESIKAISTKDNNKTAINAIKNTLLYAADMEIIFKEEVL